ncbi:MAG TPA: DNA polymerase III subunit alpha [Pirellulales bacterium]|nr:DNA polymerase III subunit alpha [Pirellulales bacterium]
MSTQPFVHLHCHSHYSLLDGASPIDKLIARAKQHGMNALALTDHGNLHGALQFYQRAKAEGINPILGYEAYIAPESRLKRDVGNLKEASYHLTLLAQNRTGFRNLIKLASKAYLEGFYFKPRIDRELLEQYHEGLICLSGCVSSQFSRALLKGTGKEQHFLAEAKEIAAWFQRLFGDRYFIEIQNNGLEIQQRQMEGAVEVARQMGLPLVATSDAHYVNQEDADAQDVMLCINTGKFRSDTNRLRMDTNQFFLRSPAEMYAAFPGLDEALKQSQLIADSVNIELELGKRHFPNFDPPDRQPPTDYLRELCLRGLKERYAQRPDRCENGELKPDVLARLDHELNVINTLGFPNYFLIVWDFVRYARQQGIPATARGSGVGSLVSYALYLSHVCPLEFDLLFERFLDLNRREAPDIDIDFCKDRRGEVIQYVKEKYGADNVAQIGTFGTLAARAAIRDVGRALGMPIPRVDAIVAMVPDVLNITLDAALEQSADLKKAYQTDGETHELLDLARKIEGLARNVGTHAAAVVIADRPLIEYVPLCRVQNKDEIITQWAMEDVERAGLLKMDFLGLRNLTVLSKAVDLIEQTTGQRVDPYQFPLDDAETFALLSRGETKGIFQLESGGIRDLLQKMKPDHFRDIIATNALYRPGPLEGGMVDDYVQVKLGRKKATYLHPVMKDVLEETHGVMVYQEQVMRILNRLGGIDLADAYTCIKAISKKNLPKIAKFQEDFIAGAVQQGLSEKQATELFELIAKFAGYGFNKSHSTAYALIAYMTAYLKAHYPLEFMAALLSGDIDGRNFKKKDSLVEHLDDCRRMGLEVLPPDVNTSQADFTVRDGKIAFALAAIKGCGGTAGDAITAARRAEGPFQSLFDFCERCDPSVVNRTAVESLIKAGAFDQLSNHSNRAALWQSLDRALQAGAAKLADKRAGQRGLFDDDSASQQVSAAGESLISVPEWPEKERLSCEKEVLGFYLSSHPLAEHRDLLATHCSHTTVEIGGLPPRAEVTLGGLLSAVKISYTKNPRPGSTHTKYAMFDVEDLEGIIRCIVWPEEFVKFGPLVQAEAILAVRGVVDRRAGSEESNLIVNELLPLEELRRRGTKGILIRVNEETHGAAALEQLRELAAEFPGEAELNLMLCLADGHRLHLKSDSLHVEVTAELRQRIDQVLGPGNVRVLTAPRPTATIAPRPAHFAARSTTAANN